MPNDIKKITRSIFKDRGKYNDLMPQDRILFYLLYYAGVTAGMPRVEALKAIYAKLNKIRPGGIKQK